MLKRRNSNVENPSLHNGYFVWLFPGVHFIYSYFPLWFDNYKAYYYFFYVLDVYNQICLFQKTLLFRFNLHLYDLADDKFRKDSSSLINILHQLFQRRRLYEYLKSYLLFINCMCFCC